MKEIKTKREIYDIHYEAIDGTIFYNKEECEKYDKSARAVLWAMFKNLVVKEGTEYSLFDLGNDDTTVYAIKVETKVDANYIKQLWELDHTYYSDRDAEYQKKVYDIIDKVLADNDVLFVGEDCDGCIYIINTRNNIINNLQNLDKKEDEKD